MADDNKEKNIPENINLDDQKFDKDKEPLLNILKEKDNLIVSLKESSTTRDKLNEKQIRMLSEDNSRKVQQLQNLQGRLNTLDAKLSQREAELGLLRVSEDKLTAKVQDFKVGFEKYKSQVRSSLDQIKISIQEELNRREEYKNQIIDNLKDNYLKLETQIQDVDNYYKEMLAEIAKKQGIAKKYIRHALNDLQEALSQLDMSHADLIEPTHIREEFSKVIEDSQNMFSEFKDMKGLPQGATIVKNIENVNVQLSETPVIEGVFQEIHQIRKTTRESLEKAATAHLGEQGAGTGGSGAEARSRKATEEKGGGGSGEGAGETGDGSSDEKKKDRSGLDKGNQGAGDKREQASSQAEKGSKAQEGASAQPLPQQAPQESRPESGKDGGGKQAKASDDRADVDEDDKKKKKKLGDEIQEVIFKRGRNYAPFNWREILSDIQLTRFESFIESCIKAEKEKKYMKALGLYKTIQEQPGITDTIAGRLLEDHIEYLEDLIKRKYSFNYKPEEPAKTVQTS